MPRSLDPLVAYGAKDQRPGLVVTLLDHPPEVDFRRGTAHGGRQRDQPRFGKMVIGGRGENLTGTRRHELLAHPVFVNDAVRHIDQGDAHLAGGVCPDDAADLRLKNWIDG